ncbi:hypothetical protein ACNVED_00425 [Legionella sp. D16C41]|uniref:hypothetical protein n=1 Tax=Legionella sp. D16C41 TaxID=3402688 RepID=UPI003AF85204
MKRVTITSLLFSAVTLSNADTLASINVSSLESQSLTPIITENPDQTIHLQPNTSSPKKFNSGVIVPNNINSNITPTSGNTNNNTNTNTGPTSIDENGNTTNTTTTIDSNNIIDITGPNSMDENGNMTNGGGDTITNLNAIPNDSTSTNLNDNTDTNDSTDNTINAPAVTTSPAINQDSGTANDSVNSSH